MGVFRYEGHIASLSDDRHGTWIVHTPEYIDRGVLRLEAFCLCLSALADVLGALLWLNIAVLCTRVGLVVV